MEVDSTTVRRLAFIKYLFDLGVSQSYKPEPARASSVLVFHDATELFLQLASELLDVGKSKIDFMEYWELLAQHISEGGLPQKESMRRLNKARVAIKHHGTLPSNLDIESFRATTQSFLSDATPLIFDLKFDQISLVDFVEAEEPRRNLGQAVSLTADHEYPRAVGKVALAFHQLIDDYEERKRSTYGRSPFQFGPQFPLVDSFFLGLDGHQSQLLATRDFQSRLGEFIDGVKDSLEAIQDAIRILAMGIDYPRYSRFRTIIPRVFRAYGGEYNVGNADENATAEEAQFCIDFTIEAALKLQEFDWSVTGENDDST